MDAGALYAYYKRMASTHTEIFEKIPYAPSAPEKDIIERAYRFARKAHEGQKRYSGEPHINHAVRTAENLAELGVDTETIAAGLLHDTIEDCGVMRDDIAREFNDNIADLVVGVSKLGGLKYQGREQYAENMRHFFLAIAKDLRVVLIKLADRLDNIRTLQYVPEHKQERIALETLEVYVPLANRLGIGRLKTELEDRAFAFAYPEESARVRNLIKERGKERERYIEKVYKSLAKQLAKAGLADAHVSYRIKDTHSIFKKLLKKDMDVAKIYDMYALRVLVPTVEDCYRALGIIHNTWKPLPQRFKDYIANPKVNGYRSLHTTVFTGDGGVAEIQIRTPEIHQDAEYGIAAHLIYKERGVTRSIKKIGEQLSWLSEIQNLHKESPASEDFLSKIKLHLFEERVFVFTPKGDVIELPKGATALDFAYAIHSEIGEHTSGAKVNGKLVSLDYELENGNIVEVVTKSSQRPTRKWLDYAKTNFAKRYIRGYLAKQPD